MARVPNHKLDGYFARLEPVENYNGTIRAYYVDGVYTVQHWNTVIARVDSFTGTFWAYPHYISQTTATLVGRVLRSRSRDDVARWVNREIISGEIDSKRARQLLKQAR